MNKKHVFKKKYGQNFLKDLNLLNFIVKKSNLEEENVVEIGPGKGILTRLILEKSKRLLAYEIDSDLKCFLNFGSNDKINIIYDDFLSRDLEKDFDKYFQEEEIILIGNLPYYITTPILFKVLLTKRIKTFIIMVQKEVGLRLISPSKTKDYNALSVLVQTLTKISKIKIVNKNMFFPTPKVDGIVLKFDKIHLEEKQREFIETDFLKFIKASFQQKRKNLLNNLSKNFNISKSQIISFLEKYQIPSNIRAEEIDIERFQKITSLFFDFFK
ncbi:dimethyladenosine transferase [Candidatus Phytoplasma luffae]|uniref:Ribosomal RNA small subunit methyltransferase A n=1 Tax=Loofah witches'-broom phytoplasma TaxID=35773 RepID=A0A975FIS3_LOWBP|nr:16S rRNA (adenine(1518)-N(6)/adenine(1519)-N(6))-dimethyltransferase RsmA [Candidatus Phytoplasma luffae]QTX03240.1 dimethyladenosine transferase [Candidatus Phytoplasma luffae]